MTDVVAGGGQTRDNSLERLLFFSDGVFAIAITLLSIELHPPHDWDGTAASLWRQGWPGFSAYALSFIVIGVFWNSHRRIFTQIRRFSGGVFALNLLLLGAIALMPFMTNLLYRDAATADAFVVYLGTVAAAGVFQGSMLAWGVFVDQSVDPSVHWSRRVTAILTAGLLPGLISAAAIFGVGVVVGEGVPTGPLLVVLGASAVLILLRAFTERRFA